MLPLVSVPRRYGWYSRSHRRRCRDSPLTCKGHPVRNRPEERRPLCPEQRLWRGIFAGDRIDRQDGGRTEIGRCADRIGPALLAGTGCQRTQYGGAVAFLGDDIGKVVDGRDRADPRRGGRGPFLGLAEGCRVKGRPDVTAVRRTVLVGRPVRELRGQAIAERLRRSGYTVTRPCRRAERHIACMAALRQHRHRLEPNSVACRRSSA